MIDFHSHILPAIDDGSRDVKESISLLEMLSAQGIKTVAATPHFRADDEQLSEFIERRRKSYESLKAEFKDDTPEIKLGAEVEYYPGISRLKGLSSLCIEDSKLLLMEMPMSKWTEYTVRELTELAGSNNVTLVLAHIERCLRFQSDDVWERLYESGIYMQTNASFFNDFGTRHKAISMLRNNLIHFLGSDCHNMTSRPPRIGQAYEIIIKKLGKDFLNNLIEFEKSKFIR